METPHDQLSPLSIAARELGVPHTWLREQIDAGHFPCLRCGTRILVHVPTIRARLVELAQAERADEKERR